MPSWSIHLAIAKRVNRKLNLDKDLFYYGNLIPDVDRKITPIRRSEAHYYHHLTFPTCPKERMIDIDHFYNNEVYSNKWVQDEDHNIIGIRFKNGKILNIDVEDKKRQKKKYKQSDFELYGKYLFRDKKVELPKNRAIVKSNIQYLKNHFLNDELVDHRFDYLNNEFGAFNKLKLNELIFKHHYKLFSKEELDKIFEDCTNMVLEKLMEVNDHKM